MQERSSHRQKERSEVITLIEEQDSFGNFRWNGLGLQHRLCLLLQVRVSRECVYELLTYPLAHSFNDNFANIHSQDTVTRDSDWQRYIFVLGGMRVAEEASIESGKWADMLKNLFVCTCETDILLKLVKFTGGENVNNRYKARE